MITRLLISLTALVLAVALQPGLAGNHVGAPGTAEAAALTCPSPRPGVVCFQINMQGTDVVPPVSTGAWGFVRFYNFNDSKTAADYTVDVKGLSGTLITGADLHRGVAGQNGPVVHHLADGGFIVMGGHMTFTTADLNDIAAGNWYVVLTTMDNPEGEMRGELAFPDGFYTSTNSAPPPLVVTNGFAQQLQPIQGSGNFVSPANPIAPIFPGTLQYGVPNQALADPIAQCYGDLSSLTFRWAPLPGAIQQWLDISYVDDVFTDGTFYSYGPLLPTDRQLTWDNIETEIPFNWRVNTLTQFGWISSSVAGYNPC